jgi:hypothetical protein
MIETHGRRTTSAYYARLGQQECEKIHLANLEILEQLERFGAGDVRTVIVPATS